MKILITGAKGFIGRNLIAALKNKGWDEILEFDTTTEPTLLDSYCKEAEFVFHLAGVNRPDDLNEFKSGNVEFSQTLIDQLRKQENTCPIVVTSSVQAILDNPYGRSKKEQENLFIQNGREFRNQAFLFRLPNVFGKWGRPNYNSVIASFCYNQSRGLPLTIDNRGKVLTFVYIDDVVDKMIDLIDTKSDKWIQYCDVRPEYQRSIGEIADLIGGFYQSRLTCLTPNMTDEFTKKLYSTYLSYNPMDQLDYSLEAHRDHRGCFAEFLRLPDSSQVSINVIKPGIRKGEHWHSTKVEKFLVVSGEGTIRLRQFEGVQMKEYHLRGEQLKVIDIPSGYVHNIENTGDADMVVVIWSNEYFNAQIPDTYYKEV